MPDTAPEAVAEPTPDSDDGVPEMYGSPVCDSRGQTVVHPDREHYVEVVKAMLDDGYTTCIDFTAVDYLKFMQRQLPEGVTPERFEVVLNLLDMVERRRIRVRVQVPADDPVLPSLFDVHPATEAYEREVFDMFGIGFEGHPDLSRILMPEDWEGHPLRKDYELGAIPVQFKAGSDVR